jgi:succinyl-diaminopimelate desuccinylase
VHSFVEALGRLASLRLDDGSENFSPSALEITSIDIGNDTRNLIPSNGVALANIRFCDLWTFEELENLVREHTTSLEVSFERQGSPTICSSSGFVDFLAGIVNATIGRTPGIGTAGGNSDAIFIKDLADVVEIGAPVARAHITDEYIAGDDLVKLRGIYLNIMKNFCDYNKVLH